MFINDSFFIHSLVNICMFLNKHLGRVPSFLFQNSFLFKFFGFISLFNSLSVLFDYLIGWWIDFICLFHFFVSLFLFLSNEKIIHHNKAFLATIRDVQRIRETSFRLRYSFQRKPSKKPSHIAFCLCWAWGRLPHLPIRRRTFAARPHRERLREVAAWDRCQSHRETLRPRIPRGAHFGPPRAHHVRVNDDDGTRQRWDEICEKKKKFRWIEEEKKEEEEIMKKKGEMNKREKMWTKFTTITHTQRLFFIKKEVIFNGKYI